jgi:UDP-N-acetyl-D-glucosamine dehydrogenase
MTTVGVVGLGYVGLPLAVALSQAGHTVVGFDTNAEIIGSLTHANSHIQDVSDAQLAAMVERGGRFSADESSLKGLDFYIICVPTPLGVDGHPNLDYVRDAAAVVGRNLTPGCLVVLESTTYPGTTEEVMIPVLEQESGLTALLDFDVAYSPERIDPGNPTFSVENTPKIVGGTSNQALQRADDLYSSLGIQVVRAKGVREAELAKLLENTYRHVNIALVNEMAKFASSLGIDLHDAIRCAATKPFGFEAFYPGPGVGGHCIPIDPNYLSYRVRAKLGYPFRFVELAQEINASMPAFVVSRLQSELNERGLALKGARIVLLGVTYKPNVADLRESPAQPIAAMLLERGSDLHYCDPFVDEWRINGHEFKSLTLDDCRGFDAVVLLQNHAEFLALDMESTSDLVLDTRSVLSGDNVRYL